MSSSGQTAIGDYETTRDDYFWPRLYDRAPPGSETIYCEVPITERARINVEHAYSRQWIREVYPPEPHEDCPKDSFDCAAANLHNLWPCLSNINSSRQDVPYADLPGESLRDFQDSGCTDFERARADDEPASAVELRDDANGDLARSILYMAITYDLPLRGMGPMLLRWHLADPPNANERWRNRHIYKLQWTENPFIRDR